jgi:hypothetical protein
MTITQIGYNKWPELSSEIREILGKLLFSRIFATYAQALAPLRRFLPRRGTEGTEKFGSVAAPVRRVIIFL